ncbi:leucine-rich repeat-containing protein 15-like [Panonychus citri]|uniref:leucine-rich repeat-containing protein 15-like n=1 Tax=Panonychus citri TaxID=50023 RepID=UPI0023071622|nr:leucine-rich repeat-containing protein 15-like [Panonychus citri]
MAKNIITRIDIIFAEYFSYLLINRIEVIENEALASLANLALLNIQGNKLIEMSDSLSKFPSSLKYLQLNNNTIYTVHNDSLTGQSGLEILVKWNKIQKLTKQVFASCSGLQKLYLENNEISSIEVGTFESLSQLIYLNLENNNLNHLSEGVFRGVTSLAKLYLSGNHLMDIEPASFSSLSLSLRYLSMSNNQLYVIRNNFFTNLSNLDELYLSNVMVEEIDHFPYTLDPGSLVNLKHLKFLDLSNNVMRYISTSS